MPHSIERNLLRDRGGEIARSSGFIGRGIDIPDRDGNYVNSLGFERAEDLFEWLKNKIVLDLGAGKGNFARDLENNHPDLNTKVISLEPLAITHREGGKKDSIGGDWRLLPIGTASVDAIVSSCAFPLYEDNEHLPIVLREIYRVLKIEGEARLGSDGGRVKIIKKILENERQPGILDFDYNIFQDEGRGGYFWLKKK